MSLSAGSECIYLPNDRVQRPYSNNGKLVITTEAIEGSEGLEGLENVMMVFLR